MTIPTPTEDELESLMFRLCFGGLSYDDFLIKYTDEVGDLEQEIVEATYEVELPRYNSSQIQVLRGGLVLLRAGSGKWSLFETEARVSEREHLRRWAEFARGRWVSTVPAEAGYYPVRAKDGKMGIHLLKYSGGRLVDVNSGYVPAGKVSNWTEEWWSLPLASLPGSY